MMRYAVMTILLLVLLPLLAHAAPLSAEDYTRLVAQLQDKDATVRLAAVNKLAEMREAKGVAPLLTVLHDTDPAVRMAAAEGAMMGGSKIDVLLELLKSDDPAVKKMVISRCRISGKPQWTEALATALKDSDAGVRTAAADGLGTTGDPRAVDALLTAVQDADAGVRVRAVYGLAEFTDPRITTALVPLRKGAGHDLQAAIIRALGKQREPLAVDTLLDALKEPDMSLWRSAIAGLCASDDPRAVTAVTAAINSDNGLLWSSATSALQASHNPAFVASLVGKLQELVREGDLPALAMLSYNAREFADMRSLPDGPQRGRLSLTMQALKNKTDALPEAALPLLHAATPLHRALGAALLVHTRDSRTLPGLAGALKDDNALVRRLAARALRVQGDVRSLPALLTALNDPDDAVRAEVALALGALQDTRATAPLLALLPAQHPDVQFAAVWALGRIADPQATKPLLACYPTCTDAGIREAIVTALGRMHDPQTADFFLTMLKDGTLQQRYDSIQALGDLKEPRAVDALITVMQTPIPATDYRLLSQSNKPEPRNEIRSLGYVVPQSLPIKQTTVRDAAITALGAIGDPRAIDPLIAMLNEPNGGGVMIGSLGSLGAATGTTIKALGHFREERVVRAFLARLAKERYPSDVQDALVYGTVSEVAMPLLVEALHDPNPLLRANVVPVLSRMASDLPIHNDAGEVMPHRPQKDPRLAGLLLAMLPEADIDLRRQLLATLGELGDTRATQPLLTAMKEADTRATALNALKALKDPGAVPGLKVMLSDKDAGLRQYAVEALGAIRTKQAGEALAMALRDTDEQVRGQAALALCANGDARGLETVLALLKAHRSDGNGLPAFAPARIIRALAGRQDPGAIMALLTMLDTEAIYTDREALLALWRSNDPRATAKLLARVRRELTPPALADELPLRHYSPTMDNLCAALREAAEYRLQFEPGDLPGKLTDPHMLELCLSLLSTTASPRYEYFVQGPSIYGLRRNAIWLLGHSASPKAVPPLIDALETGTLEERQEAAIALGKLGDKRAIEPLTAALQHVGTDARPAVEAALKAITNTK